MLSQSLHSIEVKNEDQKFLGAFIIEISQTKNILHTVLKRHTCLMLFFWVIYYYLIAEKY